MLLGIDPLLSGELLWHLDAMGHSDGLVIADGNFPAARLAARLVELPAVTAPRMLRAVTSVLPLDADKNCLLMAPTPDAPSLAIHGDLREALGARGTASGISREAFYAAASNAYLIIRTGELRPYGNAMVFKGVINEASHD